MNVMSALVAGRPMGDGSGSGSGVGSWQGRLGSNIGEFGRKATNSVSLVG